MRRDSRLTAVLAACFLPILRATWAIDPEGIDRSEAVDLVSQDLGLPILGEKGQPKEAAIKGFKWHDHVRLALLSLVYGHFCFEKWFEDRGGVTHLAGVQERQPHTIAMIDINNDGTIREVTQNTQNEPIPANRLLWYSHEREGANWAGVSMLRSCYTPWILKHEVLRVHATSIRRFGMGVPSVTAPPGGTPGQVQQAQQLASQMRAGDTAGAGLPSGFTFQLTGMTGSAPDAVQFLGTLNQEMTTSALTQMLELGQSSHGSRAMGESFLDLFLLSLQACADAICDEATIGEVGMPGLAKSLVEYNWGEGEPVPRIIAKDVGDRHEVTDTAISSMLTAGALTYDPNLEAYLREAWGLPERDAKFPLPPPKPPKGAPGAAPVPAGGGSTPSPASQQPGPPGSQAPAKEAPASGKTPAAPSPQKPAQASFRLRPAGSGLLVEPQAAFHPDQPRDWHGRWGTGASAAEVFRSVAGKVKVHRGVSDAGQAEIAAAFTKIPPEIRDRIKISKLEITSKVRTVRAPEGKIPVAGTYNYRTGELTVTTPLPAGFDVQKTVVHESLHGLDTMAGTVSGTPGFRQIADLIRTLPPGLVLDHYVPDLSSYTGTERTKMEQAGNREMFAELGARYLLGQPMYLAGGTEGAAWPPILTDPLNTFFTKTLGPPQ